MTKFNTPGETISIFYVRSVNFRFLSLAVHFFFFSFVAIAASVHPENEKYSSIGQGVNFGHRHSNIGKESIAHDLSRGCYTKEEIFDNCYPHSNCNLFAMKRDDGNLHSSKCQSLNGFLRLKIAHLPRHCIFLFFKFCLL